MTADSTAAPAWPRHAWADVARGFGIALVVLGHALRGLFNAGIMVNEGAWAVVNRFIYAFHMPLFFLLAGIFLGSRPQETFARLAARRLRRLGYPYLVWATIQMIVQALMSRHTNSHASLSGLWTIAFLPPMQFWFLYALLLQSLWIGLLAKLGADRGLVLALAAAAFVLAPITPLGPWRILSEARQFLPYTALGLFLGPLRLTSLLDRSRAQLGCMAALGFALVGLAASADARLDRMLAIGVGLVGTLSSLCLCALVSRARIRIGQVATETLTTWGRASMAIFVAHTIFSAAVRIVLHRLLHVDHVEVHIVLGMASGLLGPLLLLRITERLRFPYLFEWPQRSAATVPIGTPLDRA